MGRNYLKRHDGDRINAVLAARLQLQPSPWAVDPDAKLLCVIVPAIPLSTWELPCSALAWSTNWPPWGFVAGVATDTLQPNSYGARAFPLANALDLRGVQRIELHDALFQLVFRAD